MELKGEDVEIMRLTLAMIVRDLIQKLAEIGMRLDSFMKLEKLDHEDSPTEFIEFEAKARFDIDRCMTTLKKLEEGMTAKPQKGFREKPEHQIEELVKGQAQLAR